MPGGIPFIIGNEADDRYPAITRPVDVATASEDTLGEDAGPTELEATD
jgi:hypothetical protein